MTTRSGGGLSPSIGKRPDPMEPDFSGLFLALSLTFLIAFLLGSVRMVVLGLELLSDPGSGAGATLAGVLLLLAVVTLPAVGVLLVLRTRADRQWHPAITSRRRMPFTPGPPDLVLAQAPGRLVAGITAGWVLAVACVVLALGVHPAWWLAVAGCLAAIARLTWRLRTRPVLTISADGFEIVSGSRRAALAWDECAAFTVAPRGRVQVTVVVDRGLKPPPPHAIRAGLDGRSAEELAALLSSYLPTA